MLPQYQIARHTKGHLVR